MTKDEKVGQETTQKPASEETNKTDGLQEAALPQQGVSDQPSGQTQTESVESEGTEEAPSRYDQRIKELTDRVKQAEEERDYLYSLTMGEETNPYENGQSSSSELSEAQEAARLAAQDVMSRLEAKQQFEEAEKAHPELKDNETFARAVVGAWQSTGGRKSVKEVADEIKGISAKTGERKALSETVEKMTGAGSKARQVNKGSTVWTRERLAELAKNPDEYTKYEKEINEALARGEIQ